MSESGSKVESQLNFFGDHQTAFTNLKIERKEFTEDEFSKEDEEMMEIKQIDEQSNDLNKFDDTQEAITQFSEMSQIKDVNQFEEAVQPNEIAGRLDRLGDLSQLSEQQPNEVGPYPLNADEQKLRSELRNEPSAASVNASSPSALVSQPGPTAEQQSGELKPEPGKQPDQHLISSLNSLVQQSNSQQNNPFSQVSTFLEFWKSKGH